MLKATTTPYTPLAIGATVNGLAIYLDNFSYIELGRDDDLRKRFIAAMRRCRADVLFSQANAIELSGARGDSVHSLKALLDEIGPQWFPVEMNPAVVIEREKSGAAVSDCCKADEFLKTYVRLHRTETAAKRGQLVDLSDHFFTLSALLEEWPIAERKSFEQRLTKFDAMLINVIDDGRKECKRDPQWLDRYLPELPFDPSRPATFVFRNLKRLLIRDKGDTLKPHDGIDFCHAVIGAAFASVMTLDKHWKRRVQALPQPNQLARVYGPAELPTFVADLEAIW